MNPVVVRWKARLKIRQALLLAARRRYKAEPNRPSLVRAVRHREDQVAEAKRVIARHSTPTVPRAFPGSPVPGQRPHAATHPTGGLANFPAYDYMAPAGTPCVAPVGGTIARLSGHDPSLGGKPGGALGYSIYLNGTNGKEYFLTHLDKVRVKVGQHVEQGQQIAEVADGPRSWSTPHVHMGVKG